MLAWMRLSWGGGGYRVRLCREWNGSRSVAGAVAPYISASLIRHDTGGRHKAGHYPGVFFGGGRGAGMKPAGGCGRESGFVGFVDGFDIVGGESPAHVAVEQAAVADGRHVLLGDGFTAHQPG